jgi:hypothetical protein
MKTLSKLGIIGGAALFLTATPFSLDLSHKNVTLSLNTADARVVRPVARVGVRRGVYRRAGLYGVAGYRGVGWRYAARRAAIYGAAAYGYGAYSGYGSPAYSSYASSYPTDSSYDTSSYSAYSSYASPSCSCAQQSYSGYYSPASNAGFAFASYYPRRYWGIGRRWW